MGDGSWVIGNRKGSRFKIQIRPLLFFVAPFLLVAGIILGNHLRIGQPAAALKTARKYLEGQFPGVRWELGKMTPVGENLKKKWRLEFNGMNNEGRRIQANLLVDRWIPEKIVGRFILVLSPPQILDGGWDRPTVLGRFSESISREAFFFIGSLFLVFQCLWLYRVYRLGIFRRRDGFMLLLPGGVVLLILMILEVHFAFLVAYPLGFSVLVFLHPIERGSPNTRGDERQDR